MNMGEIGITKVEDTKFIIEMPAIRLEVGSEYRLSPSYGYDSIEAGVVEVTNLVTAEEYMAHRDLYPGIHDYIATEEEYIGEGNYNPPLWVEYKYLAKEDTYQLPVYLFMIHTSLL